MMRLRGILKQAKDEVTAYLTALEKKGLDRRTDHKTETQLRSARPTPWRDKHATIEYVRKSKRRYDRNESMLWFAASCLEYQATFQEGVMNFMFPFEKSGTHWNVHLNVSDMKVTDKDDFPEA